MKEYKNMIILQIDRHWDWISSDVHEKLICLCSSSSVDCAASVLPNRITTFKINLIWWELNAIMADLQPLASYYDATGWKIKSGSCQKMIWFLLTLKEETHRDTTCTRKSHNNPTCYIKTDGHKLGSRLWLKKYKFEI